MRIVKNRRYRKGMIVHPVFEKGRNESGSILPAKLTISHMEQCGVQAGAVGEWSCGGRVCYSAGLSIISKEKGRLGHRWCISYYDFISRERWNIGPPKDG